MKRIEKKDGIVQLIADEGKGLKRVGSEASPVTELYTTSEDAEQWEEVESGKLEVENGEPEVSKDEYRKEVERLIALRYTTGQEIQFSREREGADYDAYLAYVEDCKRMAPESIRLRRESMRQMEAEAEREAEAQRKRAEAEAEAQRERDAEIARLMAEEEALLDEEEKINIMRN